MEERKSAKSASTPPSIYLSSLFPDTLHRVHDMHALDSIKLSLDAMATRFELVLYGDDFAHLRAAGEEALQEIERLDRQLSFYREESDITRINALASKQPVKVEARLFRLLQKAKDLSDRTGGAFDITIAPLMKAWGFVGGDGRVPDPETLKAAMAITGMHHVLLDEENLTVSFDADGVQLDLGAIGKGYAIEQACRLLEENGVRCGLLHGGTSSVTSIGSQPDGTPWKIGIRRPDQINEFLDVVELRDLSLSVSASHGKSFVANGIEMGHVIDPRTGQPSKGASLAAVIGPCATECDGLSTALLVLGKDGLQVLSEQFGDYRGVVY